MAPVKRVEMSSERLVRIVSQFAQENRRVPPIWSKKILPIFRTYGSLYSIPESKTKHHIKKALEQKNWNSRIPHTCGRVFFKPIQLMIAQSCSSVGELLNLQSAPHQDKLFPKVTILPIRWLKYKLITLNRKNTNLNLKNTVQAFADPLLAPAVPKLRNWHFL